MWKYCFRSAAGWALDEQKSTCEWTCALPTLVVQRSAVFLNHSSAGILSLLRNLLWLLFIYFNLFNLEFILFSALTQSSTLASFSGLPLPDISLVLNQDFPTSLLPPPLFLCCFFHMEFSLLQNIPVKNLMHLLFSIWYVTFLLWALALKNLFLKACFKFWHTFVWNML